MKQPSCLDPCCQGVSEQDWTAEEAAALHDQHVEDEKRLKIKLAVRDKLEQETKARNLERYDALIRDQKESQEKTAKEMEKQAPARHNLFFNFEDLVPELVKCDDQLAPGEAAQARRRRRIQTVKESEVPSVSSLTNLSGETPFQEAFPSLGTAVRTPERQKMPRADFKRSTRWSMRTIKAENKACQQILKPLIERRPAPSLRPLATSDEWEYVEAILDSGASVTVIPPHIGPEYETMPSEASRAGVVYEIANGDEIPNLGEKLLPVMTVDGSYRGLRAQVADVSKALQSVRSLVRAGHVVVFGGGEDGSENYIVNKYSGETTPVKDDGVNYLMGMYIVPKKDAGFGRPAASP